MLDKAMPWNVMSNNLDEKNESVRMMELNAFGNLLFIYLKNNQNKQDQITPFILFISLRYVLGA